MMIEFRDDEVIVLKLLAARDERSVHAQITVLLADALREHANVIDFRIPTDEEAATVGGLDRMPPRSCKTRPYQRRFKLHLGTVNSLLLMLLAKHFFRTAHEQARFMIREQLVADGLLPPVTIDPIDRHFVYLANGYVQVTHAVERRVFDKLKEKEGDAFDAIGHALLRWIGEE